MFYAANNQSTPVRSSSNSSVSDAINQEILGKDDFLKLLTTQLRYQDPINPVEDQAFVAQLAQFSSLEQMQNLNQTMQSMMAAQQQLTALGQAMNMMGKEVELLTKSGEHFFGTVQGVQFKDAWPMLKVDGQLYDFAEVVAINQGGESNG